MCAGLRIDAEDGCAQLRLPRDTPLKDPATLLPYMYFPVVNWRAAIALQIVGEQVPLSTLAPLAHSLAPCVPLTARTQVPTPEGKLRVVNVEEHFARLSRYELAGDALAGWRHANSDVPPLAAGVSLHVLRLSTGEFYWLRRMLCVASNVSQLFFYSSKSHLVYDLNANAGGPCAFETAGRVQWDEMLSGSCIFDPFNVDNICLYPIMKDASTGLLYLRRYTFDSGAYDALCLARQTASARNTAAVARGTLAHPLSTRPPTHCLLARSLAHSPPTHSPARPQAPRSPPTWRSPGSAPPSPV